MKISGLIVDAGPVNSPVLVSVGHPVTRLGSAPLNDPDVVQDVFFRIGGAETTPVSATVSLLDNADNSIIDDVWAWRADHGNDVGWTENTAATGVVVTGDDVTAYGLAVEHYQKYEVVWSGQGGTDVFFQNELPYDPPQPVGLDGDADPGRVPSLPRDARKWGLSMAMGWAATWFRPNDRHSLRCKRRSRPPTRQGSSSTTSSPSVSPVRGVITR